VYNAIPLRKSSTTHYNVAGWNVYVNEKHVIAREAFLDWMRAGKPNRDALFDQMKRTRAVFKLSLRYCKNHLEEMKAAACANSLMDNDYQKFWSSVYKISNSKASGHVNCINGMSGSENITNMWRNYFENLYCVNVGSKYRSLFENKLISSSMETSNILFTVSDVISAVNKQKLSKAAGADAVHMEAFVYGSNRLYV